MTKTGSTGDLLDPGELLAQQGERVRGGMTVADSVALVVQEGRRSGDSCVARALSSSVLCVAGASANALARVAWAAASAIGNLKGTGPP